MGPIQEASNEADEIVYQMDEEGFLMDENGNYLIDQDGVYLRLDDKQIEELRRNNCVIE